ncbi:long-chain-fatty-acid--CoA ligase [Gemmata sp.]|uniref:long-chain-fatty-acid--CoA ligase n=1 Tax=Gemmata sp. TaxID=1914242 RepID=UPI003F6EF552
MVAVVQDHRSGHPWVSHYPQGVPTHLDYPDEPVHWLLERAAARTPDRVACQFFRQALTYAELLDRSRRFAAALKKRGLRAGDRVGIVLPNTPEYLVALFGTWMAGGVTVPLNPLMVPDELAEVVRSTGCRYLVSLDLLLPLIGSADNGQLDAVYVTSLGDRLPWFSRQLYRFARLHRLGVRGGRVPGVAVDLDEALANAPDFVADRVPPGAFANIMPSGGTTGTPKSVLLTHRNLVSNAWQVLHWNGRRVGEDVVLAVLPFFHSYGLTACALCGVAMSATLVLHHRFKADAVLRLIEQWRPTLVPAVPAMLAAFNAALVRRRYDLGAIRSVMSGGAPLSPDVAAEFSERSGAVVVEGYGLSEASPVTHAGPLDGTARPGTIGLPMPDTEAMIVDATTGVGPLPFGAVGELVVRGPQVMAGYWNDPEATAQALRNGWLYTGDLATCDADGFFKIVDRKKDLIITSGVNVYPTDVEHVLRGCPQVADVAVLGVPDKQRGELVKAVVVPKDMRAFSRRAFDDFVRQHLEVHKRPRVVEVVAGQLPRTMLGKVLRRALRDQPPQASGGRESPG